MLTAFPHMLVHSPSWQEQAVPEGKRKVFNSTLPRPPTSPFPGEVLAQVRLLLLP